MQSHLYPAALRDYSCRFPFPARLDSVGTEFELTKTVDISATGALVLSRRSFHPDQHLRITIPVSSAPSKSPDLCPRRRPPYSCVLCALFRLAIPTQLASNF